MRVIAGSAKKRRLKSPGRLNVRPTSDRVKEALFNMINPILPGSLFADFYAGTGGVGIEAISRGARAVVYVEKNPQAVALIKDNLHLTGFAAATQIMPYDLTRAVGFLRQKKYLFDIIFADPPYQKGLAEDTLKLLSQGDILQQQGLLIIETSIQEILPGLTGNLKQVRRSTYGDTALTFFKPELEEENCAHSGLPR